MVPHWIDIDEHELSKGTINIDVAIRSDAKKFLNEMLKMNLEGLPIWSEWITKCREWREMFPSDSYNGFCLKKFSPEENKIYPFHLMKIISKKLSQHKRIYFPTFKLIVGIQTKEMITKKTSSELT